MKLHSSNSHITRNTCNGSFSFTFIWNIISNSASDTVGNSKTKLLYGICRYEYDLPQNSNLNWMPRSETLTPK